MPFSSHYQRTPDLFPVTLGGALAASGPSRAWPVWRDSTTDDVKWQPMTMKRRWQIWKRARALDQATRQPGSGKHGGALGRVALDVLYALLFDFMNAATGRLDPSHEAIARKAGCCETAAKDALNKLQALGLLTWVRRAAKVFDEAGRFLLRQLTNAYGILSERNWQGWQEPAPPPPPEPWQWGACPPLPSVLQQAIEAARAGEGREAQLQALEADPGDGLAASLARIGRALFAPKP